MYTIKLLCHKSAPADQRGKSGDGDNDSLIAFPNDRYASVRPTERGKRFRTIFTRANRHNYSDPDYSYTDEEMAAIEAHRKHYQSFIDNLREERREKVRVKEHKEYGDDLNIGVKVAAGLKPKKLTLADIKDDPRPPTPPNSNWKLTSSKELEALEKQTIDKPVCDGLKAIPQTDQEKKECSAYLTPSDLHKIVIGPAFINFGDVCMRSTNTNHINIVNNLESFIYVQVGIDCRELRQTSPLSQVVPPMSRAAVPVIFESNAKGKFQRSINYSINGFYKNHLTVVANVVPPSLVMHTDSLEIGPTIGLPADAG
ncbi:CHDC2 [Bugula neritina]|uniref:CHDC2 n=1 Tax=Bugula neritina TaxID=10212 RepID=A0A7J7KGS3_BUGNE|nr:CHDC2 [Bugula neritina]